MRPASGHMGRARLRIEAPASGRIRVAIRDGADGRRAGGGARLGGVMVLPRRVGRVWLWVVAVAPEVGSARVRSLSVGIGVRRGVLMAPGFVRAEFVAGEGEVEARGQEGGCACGVGGGGGSGFRPAAGRISNEKGIRSKKSGNEVYYSACSVLVILKNSCSQLHCQKVVI